MKGELPPLDIQPLRERGVLPPAMEETDLGKARPWERPSLVRKNQVGLLAFLALGYYTFRPDNN